VIDDPSPAPAPPQSEIRTATLVFSDLAGSTSLGERLDPETLRSILTRYFDEMRSVFSAHGGVIEKIIGDAIVAVFESRDHADAAAAAVRAVSDARAALAALNDVIEGRWGVRLANRTGVATGDLIAQRLAAGHSVLSGDVVSRAEALERAAPHLEALTDAATRALTVGTAAFADHGPIPDGATGSPTPAFLLQSVERSDRDAVAAASVCPTCGQSTDEAGRCPACGTIARSTRETRRTVTVVFADPRPVAIDPRGKRPESVSAAMSHAFDQLRTVLEGHGATVETFIGDAVMAVFGLPVRHEDDALRSVRAADEMRRRIPVINETLRERWGIELGCPVGVNTGEVIAGDAATGQRLVTGDTVNVAARLEQSAEPGQVLIGGLTYRLVRDAVEAVPVEPLTLKGKAEPVPAYRLDSVAATATATSRFPLVGREAELDVLVAALADAVASSRVTLASVIGDAGVGKSRLLEEFESRARDRGARVVKGRCLPYGDGITFWPIVEIVRSLAAIDDSAAPADAAEGIRELVGVEHDDVAERLASVIGLTEATFPVSETLWAVRRLCEIVAAQRPLVVWFEDLHWAEPTLLELIGHLVASVQAPVTVLCAARPALLESQADWSTGPDQARIDLAPLGPEDAERIIDNVLGDADLPPRARARLVEASQGNPLFVEQLLSMLIDEGRLLRVDDRWETVDDLDTLEIPPSIHALLASRIDRLGDEERNVVEPASVVGRVFATDALAHLLSDHPVAERLPDHLGSLTVRRIVEAQPESPTEAEAFRFLHLMLRDAAYAGLLKDTRAMLHEQFVRWADRVNSAAGRSQEFDEILGYHLEQAYRYRTELGPIDEHTVTVGLDGSRRLAAAGHRAFARGDMPAAAGLLRRAADLLDESHPDLPGLLLRAGESSFETGDFDGSAKALERSASLAEAAGDAGAAAAARAERLRVAYLTGNAGSSEEVEAQAARLLEILEAQEHDPGLARLWRLRAMIEVVAARFGAAEEAALRMVAHAARAGDEVLEVRTLQNIAALAHVGPTPVDEAIALCEEILSRVESDRRAAANTRRSLAQLHAMAGDIGTARELYRGARSTLDRLGWRHDAALVSLDSGPIELLAGDPAVAERELQGDYDTLADMGDTFFRPTTAAFLAEALYRQGRFDEAEARAQESADTADPDDLAPQVLWRGVMAMIEARRGEAGALVRAREAVAMSEGSDAPILQAGAFLALAETALLLGERGLAAEAAAKAAQRYEAKGSTAGVARAGRLLDG
jgi:class 3 adenylate cyclase/tetratricopeptide (TPR) repeat protein